MSIGLKRGTVLLEEHQLAWEENARDTISDIQTALDGLNPIVEHVGRTSIKSIKAKPIIDIAIAVNDFDEVIARNNKLAEYSIIFRFDERPEHLLYVKGDFEADTRTHHIHVVLKNSKEWKNYLNFRDYLNSNEQAASEYEAVKIEMAELYPNDRDSYLEGKSKIISRLLLEAENWREKSSCALLLHQS